MGLWESVAEENVARDHLRMTADYREGFAAFQQKREAEFSGGSVKQIYRLVASASMTGRRHDELN
ncbi:hypothetical protein BKA04_002268 [Cryobacterium mesophilum]|nr:hypothetical protein [Terrimesophilobacter mesophilus]